MDEAHGAVAEAVLLVDGVPAELPVGCAALLDVSVPWGGEGEVLGVALAQVLGLALALEQPDSVTAMLAVLEALLQALPLGAGAVGVWMPLDEALPSGCVAVAEGEGENWAVEETGGDADPVMLALPLDEPPPAPSNNPAVPVAQGVGEAEGCCVPDTVPVPLVHMEECGVTVTDADAGADFEPLPLPQWLPVPLPVGLPVPRIVPVADEQGVPVWESSGLVDTVALLLSEAEADALGVGVGSPALPLAQEEEEGARDALTEAEAQREEEGVSMGEGEPTGEREGGREGEVLLQMLGRAGDAEAGALALGVPAPAVAVGSSGVAVPPAGPCKDAEGVSVALALPRPVTVTVALAQALAVLLLDRVREAIGVPVAQEEGLREAKGALAVLETDGEVLTETLPEVRAVSVAHAVVEMLGMREEEAQGVVALLRVPRTVTLEVRDCVAHAEGLRLPVREGTPEEVPLPAALAEGEGITDSVALCVGEADREGLLLGERVAAGLRDSVGLLLCVRLLRVEREGRATVAVAVGGAGAVREGVPLRVALRERVERMEGGAVRGGVGVPLPPSEAEAVRDSHSVTEALAVEVAWGVSLRLPEGEGEGEGEGEALPVALALLLSLACGVAESVGRRPVGVGVALPALPLALPRAVRVSEAAALRVMRVLPVDEALSTAVELAVGKREEDAHPE